MNILKAIAGIILLFGIGCGIDKAYADNVHTIIFPVDYSAHGMDYEATLTVEFDTDHNTYSADLVLHFGDLDIPAPLVGDTVVIGSSLTETLDNIISDVENRNSGVTIEYNSDDVVDQIAAIEGVTIVDAESIEIGETEDPIIEEVTLIEKEIPSYIKKESKADKVVDKVTATIKKVNSPSDIQDVVDKYGNIYVTFPEIELDNGSNITVRTKRERGDQTSEVIWSSGPININCFFNKKFCGAYK